MANKIVTYVKGAHEEMKKVVWPSRKEITNHTLLVIGISLAFALFLGGIDYILNFFVELIIR